MTPRPDSALDNYRAIADAIATLFFPHAEVVLHDALAHPALLGHDEWIEEFVADGTVT